MAPALAKIRVPIIPFHKKGCQEKYLLHDGRTQGKRAPLFPLPLLLSLQIFPCRSVLDAARAKQLKRESIRAIDLGLKPKKHILEKEKARRAALKPPEDSS